MKLLMLLIQTIIHTLGIMVIVMLSILFIRDHFESKKNNKPVEIIDQQTTPVAPSYILQPEKSA